MGAVLGDNRYGKAEIRLLKVDRDSERHVLHDLNVSVALSGAMEAVHLHGDNAAVLPTDTQKNTVYALAREHGVGEIEDFASRLARHFVTGTESVQQARVHVEKYTWERLGDAPHSFALAGREVRTATVTYGDRGERVLSGLTGLVLLSSTASEFRGFLEDRYTTLAETSDRVLCTSVDATWRHRSQPEDWGESFAAVRSALTAAFADTYSRSLQQTLFAMGERVVSGCDGLVEVRLTLPNRHHFPVDLSPFGMDNPSEVFRVDDRPFGLIEGTVLAEGAVADVEPW
jgi:urate oxidase